MLHLDLSVGEIKCVKTEKTHLYIGILELF